MDQRGTQDLPPVFSSEELLSAIHDAKSGTAPGYDNIHLEFLKNLGPKALSWLTSFYTRIPIDNTIPRTWRKAKIIAIEKPGKDLKLAASYRPISLLSTCYKLFERLLLNRITTTVEEILSPHQAGFRRGRSTFNQVAALTTFIENGFQQRLKTGAVFLDLTAAFDTVWHEGLLFKISHCLPAWFSRLVALLLRDRRYRVHIGEDVSAWRTQRNGLPQGSVLSPTLFNLYTNDMPDTYSRKFGYADDYCFGAQASSFTDIENSLSSDMELVTTYCKKWRLIPNPSKTVTCVFHLHNAMAKKELAINLAGKRLKHDPNPVYLGVTLDRTLSYKAHLTKLSSKIKSRTNLLSKLAGSSWGSDAGTLRQSALTTCYSAAEYCCPVWFRSSHAKKIDTQLNSTMRLISGTLRPTPLPWLPVLANIAPPHLRRKAIADKLLSKISEHTDWPLYQDIFEHPQRRLKSRHPLWHNSDPIDVNEQWKLDWKTAQVVNSSLVDDPAIRQPGFNTLLRHQWCLLNRFRTSQGHCNSCYKQWGLTDCDLCPCGMVQTMSHIVDFCPHTSFEGGIKHLHFVDESAINWLTSYGTNSIR